MFLRAVCAAAALSAVPGDSGAALAAGAMDANELNHLLEDVREYLDLVKGKECDRFLSMLTDIAAENKIAHKAIGHIIEQHLLKVSTATSMLIRFRNLHAQDRRGLQADPAMKVPALMLIDSICQKVGEPYTMYFSTNIGKVRGPVFRECARLCLRPACDGWHAGTAAERNKYLYHYGTGRMQMYAAAWKTLAADSPQRQRIARWVKYHETKRLFPPSAIDAMKAAIGGQGVAEQPAAGPGGRVDPRRARAAAQPPAHASAPAGMPGATPVQPPVAPGNYGAPYHHPSFGVPPAPMLQQPWVPPGHVLQVGVPPSALPGPPIAGAGAQRDPLAQYRAAQAAQPGLPVVPHIMAPPLSTTFKGVRLQVRYAMPYPHVPTEQLVVAAAGRHALSRGTLAMRLEAAQGQCCEPWRCQALDESGALRPRCSCNALAAQKGDRGVGMRQPRARLCPG